LPNAKAAASRTHGLRPEARYQCGYDIDVGWSFEMTKILAAVSRDSDVGLLGERCRGGARHRRPRQPETRPKAAAPRAVTGAFVAEQCNKRGNVGPRPKADRQQGPRREAATTSGIRHAAAARSGQADNLQCNGVLIPGSHQCPRPPDDHGGPSNVPSRQRLFRAGSIANAPMKNRSGRNDSPAMLLVFFANERG